MPLESTFAFRLEMFFFVRLKGWCRAGNSRREHLLLSPHGQILPQALLPQMMFWALCLRMWQRVPTKRPALGECLESQQPYLF